MQLSLLPTISFFSVTMAADAYSGVTVSSLSDCGLSKPKYDEPVTLKTCYDPNGLSVTVQSGSVQSASFKARVTFENCTRHVFCYEICHPVLSSISNDSLWFMDQQLAEIYSSFL